MDGRRPLLATVADGPGGVLAAHQQGMTVSRPGVLVTAFGPNPDGQGTLLRLWDQSGVSGPVNIVLPPGLHAATLQPVDPRGRKTGNPIAVKGDAAKIQLGVFAPASFLVQP
jgi:alpha-mannosidase